MYNILENLGSLALVFIPNGQQPESASTTTRKRTRRTSKQKKGGKWSAARRKRQSQLMKAKWKNGTYNKRGKRGR